MNKDVVIIVGVVVISLYCLFLGFVELAGVGLGALAGYLSQDQKRGV